MQSFFTLLWSCIIILVFVILTSLILERLSATNKMLHSLIQKTGATNAIDNELKQLLAAGNKKGAFKKIKRVYGLNHKQAERYINKL